MPRSRRPDESALLQAAFGDWSPAECLKQLPRCPALGRALWWLDRGAGWEAHVILEQLWRHCRDQRLQLLLSGLIHIGAAQVKAREGNVRGAARHLEKAHIRIREGRWHPEALAPYGISPDRLRRWQAIAAPGSKQP